MGNIYYPDNVKKQHTDGSTTSYGSQEGKELNQAYHTVQSATAEHCDEDNGAGYRADLERLVQRQKQKSLQVQLQPIQNRNFSPSSEETPVVTEVYVCIDI